VKLVKAGFGMVGMRNEEISHGTFVCSFSEGDTQKWFNIAGVFMISTISRCIEGVGENRMFKASVDDECDSISILLKG
jgi:hypothetical protein